jgi:transcriptional regulator with XRE-family HTH domain
MTPDRVREIREQLGLTQSQLGRLLGLAPANAARTIRKWETRGLGYGPSGPGAAALALLADLTPRQTREAFDKMERER